MKTEYLGITETGIKVVVRHDGSHYRAFTLLPGLEGKQVGSPWIKFSDLSKELGLKMDGSRPETAPAAAAEIPGDENVPPLEHAKAVTREKVAVTITFNGTHYVAKDAGGCMVGSPRVKLADLDALLGLTYTSDSAAPEPTETEEEAEMARLIAEEEKAKAEQTPPAEPVEAAGASAAAADERVEHTPQPQGEPLPEEPVATEAE